MNRLGLLLWQTRNTTRSTTEAYHTLAKVHFDYALKTPAERMMELFIPFYSFTMKNMHYWSEVVTEKPWAMRMLRDVMTPIWDLDAYTPEELERNRSLKHRILTGNIQLFDSSSTLKVNPSFMDALQIATNPVEQLRSRLIPPAAYLTNGLIDNDWSKPQQMIPMAGAAAQRIETGVRNTAATGNPMHIMSSVVGRTRYYQDYVATRRNTIRSRHYDRRGSRHHAGKMVRVTTPIGRTRLGTVYVRAAKSMINLKTQMAGIHRYMLR